MFIREQQVEPNSASLYKKDIDSDNKSGDSDDSRGANVKKAPGKRSSMMQRLEQAAANASHAQNNQPVVSNLDDGDDADNRSRIEVRGVETIEEFFRPEFTQNTNSLNEINDDSEDENKGIGKRISALQRSSVAKQLGPFPNFSDNDSSSQNSQMDISRDNNKSQFRNMGFPNMNYLDPDAQGPPLQTQTYYKNFEDNQDNDIKIQREEQSNAREQMPNNTFIKLFHFLNADADGAT